jgi:DNA-binding CsgD family transcriptional regulator
MAELVGRSDAVGVLRAFTGRAAVSGGALIVVGEPGVGKTSLLGKAAEDAAAAGTRIMRVTGVEFESDISYASLHQLLTPVAGSIRSLDDRYAPALQAAFGPGASAPPERLAVADAVRHLLLQESRDRAVLVVADDLQWMDRSSSAVLTTLARRLEGSRIGFLGSARPAAEGFFERARLDQYTLLPLTDAESAELLDSRFPDLAPLTRRRVLASAGGNPLALMELPAAMAGSGHEEPDWQPGVIPLNHRLQVAFASRLDALPDDTRQALLLAALEGTGSLQALDAATGGRLVDALAPAESAGLVRVIEFRSRVEFHHPLTRSAVVSASTASERRQAHRRLAAAFRGDPDRRAWHLAQGTIGPDEAAAASLEAAAYRLVGRGDTVGAVAALTNASVLSPSMADRARRLANAAFVGAHLGGGLAAAGDTLRAAHLADPLGAGSLDAATATAFVILNADGDVDTAHKILAGALETVRQGTPVTFQLRAALYTLLYVCFFGARTELWAPFDAALSQLDDQALAVLKVARQTYVDPAYADHSAYDSLDALIAGSGQVIDPAEVIAISVCGCRVDRLGGCRAALQRALHQGRDADDMHVTTQALSLLGFGAFFEGRWQETERYMTQAEELMERHGFRLYLWSVQYWLAVIAAVRGADATAKQITDELLYWAVPRGVLIVSYLCHHARTLAAMGRQDYEEAYQEATSISPAGTIPHQRPLALWVVLDIVEAAIRTNRRLEALAHVQAARRARLADISGRMALLVAAAEALVTEGATAQAHFERALAIPLPGQWPFERARVELLYGQHLRRARAPRAARPHLDAALRTFERLGAIRWAEMARHELRAAGAHVKQHSTSTSELTPRELLIAQLAATGMSNKEISERLAVSSRTISAHLYRIFPKLGITSRAGLRDALDSLKP